MLVQAPVAVPLAGTPHYLISVGGVRGLIAG